MMCSQPVKIKFNRLQPYYVVTMAGKGIARVPCGQCLNCRINQARVWTQRILLEQTEHGDSVFVTLTYEPRHLPDPAHVSPKELQKFYKRLRYYVAPKKFRYFGVGEYGDRSMRPHYHTILFGLGEIHESSIKRAWIKGFSHVGELNKDSARYMTGYITKKIKKYKKRHPEDYGKAAEFMLSSRKPGIGADCIDKISKKLDNSKHWKNSKDFLNTIRIGSKKYPVGRYLSQRSADALGIERKEFMKRFWLNQIDFQCVKDVNQYERRSNI